MTKLKFYNGLREIGGTFVEVETDCAKCMFDFGFGVVDRLDDKVKKREHSLAADYAALGMLVPADGIYDAANASLLGVTPYGKTDKECFFVISHMHIDHMGGLGVLHSDIPVYMSKDSLTLYRRLEANGDVQDGKGHANCIGVAYGEEFSVGDIRVKVLPIDHDVIGACGYLITTPDGSICYTGDYRFHGFHPDVTEAFARSAHGADVVITEGVSVSFADIDMLTLEKPEESPRTEEGLIAEVVEYVKNNQGLLVINPYNRNVERLHRLGEALRAAGRTLVTDYVQADYVHAFYPQDALTVYAPAMNEKQKEQAVNVGFHIAERDALLSEPHKYVLSQDYADSYELISLKGVVSGYFHMDGSPLGDYDPSYRKMKSLLEVLGIPYEYKGTGGHAQPYFLRHMVDTIHSKTLIPLHSFRPEQVASDCVEERILPQYGDVYRMEQGRLIKE